MNKVKKQKMLYINIFNMNFNKQNELFYICNVYYLYK